MDWADPFEFWHTPANRRNIQPWRGMDQEMGTVGRAAGEIGGDMISGLGNALWGLGHTALDALMLPGDLVRSGIMALTGRSPGPNLRTTGGQLLGQDPSTPHNPLSLAAEMGASILTDPLFFIPTLSAVSKFRTGSANPLSMLPRGRAAAAEPALNVGPTGFNRDIFGPAENALARPTSGVQSANLARGGRRSYPWQAVEQAEADVFQVPQNLIALRGKPSGRTAMDALYPPPPPGPVGGKTAMDALGGTPPSPKTAMDAMFNAPPGQRLPHYWTPPGPGYVPPGQIPQATAKDAMEVLYGQPFNPAQRAVTELDPLLNARLPSAQRSTTLLEPRQPWLPPAPRTQIQTPYASGAPRTMLEPPSGTPSQLTGTRLAPPASEFVPNARGSAPSEPMGQVLDPALFTADEIANLPMGRVIQNTQFRPGALSGAPPTRMGGGPGGWAGEFPAARPTQIPRSIPAYSGGADPALDDLLYVLSQAAGRPGMARPPLSSMPSPGIGVAAEAAPAAAAPARSWIERSLGTPGVPARPTQMRMPAAQEGLAISPNTKLLRSSQDPFGYSQRPQTELFLDSIGRRRGPLPIRRADMSPEMLAEQWQKTLAPARNAPGVLGNPGVAPLASPLAQLEEAAVAAVSPEASVGVGLRGRRLPESPYPPGLNMFGQPSRRTDLARGEALPMPLTDAEFAAAQAARQEARMAELAKTRQFQEGPVIERALTNPRYMPPQAEEISTLYGPHQVPDYGLAGVKAKLNRLQTNPMLGPVDDPLAGITPDMISSTGDDVLQMLKGELRGRLPATVPHQLSAEVGGVGIGIKKKFADRERMMEVAQVLSQGGAKDRKMAQKIMMDLNYSAQVRNRLMGTGEVGPLGMPRGSISPEYALEQAHRLEYPRFMTQQGGAQLVNDLEAYARARGLTPAETERFLQDYMNIVLRKQRIVPGESVRGARAPIEHPSEPFQMSGGVDAVNAYLRKLGG